VLVLFDIDGTLLTGDGVGMRAMREAGREIFGDAFTADGVEYAGRLDPLILSDLLEANGLEATIDQRIDFRLRYAQALERELDQRPVRRLQGARELVDALVEEQSVTLGVLTGNFPETGTMKLRSAGYELDAFEVCVWGDDSPHDPPHRDHLPKVAARRYAELRGGEIASERVVIIGDTPGDVGCATANGHHCLAVATGRYGLEDLEGHRPTRAIDGLSDHVHVRSWILETLARGGGVGLER
jgi:phosphoglycolate phosphatase-like HAD superfamily hydrolase